MADMVDSKKQKLDAGQVMLISAQNTGEAKKYGEKAVMSGIMSGLSVEGTQVRQFGNTLFVVNPQDETTAFFRALNADTAKNYLENSYQFLDWAKNELGLTTLVTEFTDNSILNLFKMISANPPFQGMGYKPFHMKSGATRVFLNLGAK